MNSRGGTTMKWSQGLCSAILLDGFYFFSPPAGANPRKNRAFPGASREGAATPNALAADWGLAPEAGAARLLDAASLGVLKRRSPDLTVDS
jgi:hypothetical protein